MKQLLTILLVSITITLQAAPGGVSSNLQLWLKADAGISQTDGQTLTNWTDQSLNAYPATNGGSDGQTSPTFKNNASDNINFNPTVEFDGAANGVDLAGNYIFSTNDGLTFFAAVKPDVEPNEYNYIFGFGGEGCCGMGFRYANDSFGMTSAGGYGGAGSAFISHNFNTDPVIFTGKIDFSNEQRIYLNGNSVYNGAITLSQITSNEINESSIHDGTSIGPGPVTIGRQSKALLGNDRLFDGKIAEVIIYDADLADADRNKVQSYLAIKYGITLDSTINYVNSSGTTIYPSTGSHSGYINDIAGIGTDGDLNQPASRSVNSDSIVTITGSGIADGNFLIWGNDDGSTIEQTSELPSNISKRLGREWKVAEVNGDVGDVVLTSDVSSLGLTWSIAVLLIDTDGDGDLTTGTITQNSVDVDANGIATFTSNLGDGDVFTFCGTSHNNVVDNLGDVEDCSNGAGNNTLREAIANANAGDTITFDPSIVGKTITLSNQLTIDKDLTIDGTGQKITISGNNAVRVFEVTAGTVTFNNLTIANGNSSGTGGAGIYNNSNLIINQTTFINNRVTAGIPKGGAIFNDLSSTSAIINNSTFFGNYADNGGGVYNFSTMTIKNSTFSDNEKEALGWGADIRNQGTLNLQNTILTNAILGENCYNEGTISTNTNNLIEDGTCSPALSGDPLLSALADNGGDTQTMALLPGSPAINAGDNATCESTDQRGETRSTSGTGWNQCDIGAYEFIHTSYQNTTVSSIVDSLDDDTSTSNNSLRDAIYYANAGDTITFDPSIVGKTITLSNQLTIDKNLTIDGTGRNITISGGGAVRVFEVTAGTVVFDSLIIANGKVLGNDGGGILNSSTLTVNNCTISNNFANSGAAITNFGGTLVVNKSSFFDNSSTFEAGAIRNASGGTVTINNCTVYNNTANNGGGLLSDGSSSTTVSNSTFSNNSATTMGGGIYNVSGSTLHLKNSIFANNTSTDCVNTGTIGTNTNNLIEDGSCSSPTNLSANPNLGSLQDNGGTTQTMALLPGSPAINAGDNATCEATDQRGETRPKHTTCDIGAYEYELKAPTNLAANSLSTQVNLSWTDNSLDETGFTVERDGPLITTTTNNVIDYSDNNVTCETNYSYSIAATNASITSTPITTNTTTAICPPTNLSANTISETQIDLSWTDNSTSETGFLIERAGSLITTTAANATSYSNSGLSCGTTYSYSVIATDGTIDSTAITASATTSACPVTVYHNLTVEKTGNGTITTSYGIDCGTDCEYDYADQTELTLTQTPDTSWIFTGWNGDCDDDGEVRINKDKTCTANFVQEHTLTINVEGEGTVDGCGTSCTQTHLSGEAISLTTSSEGIWALDNWAGDCDEEGNITMDSNKTCTATFVEGYPLTIVIASGKGKVKTETQECKESCEEIIAANSTIKLIAEPEVEWVLDSFSGDCDAEGNVNMTGEKSCTALFIKDPDIPNNGDGNGDGIHDADQPNVVSMRDQSSGNYLTLDISESVTVKEIYTDLAENQSYFDEKYIFPQGLVYFELEGTEADITIYYHSLKELRATPHFQKYGNKTPGDMNTLGWYLMPNVEFDIVEVGGQPVVTANYHLTDGELGDSTGVDGRIIDPGGLVFDTDFDNIIGFTSKNESISVQNSTADIIISRSGIKGNVTVDYTTMNDTATAGQDYQSISGTLNWSENDRSDKTINVPILTDATSGEILKVKLSNLISDSNSVLGIDTTNITFNNETVVVNDTTISFSARGYSAFKTETTATITVNRIGTQGIATVDYSTIDGTAIAGQDYQTTNGTLTWPNGDDSPKTFTVTMLNSASSGDSLLLTLNNADNIQLNIDTAILAILDVTTPTVTDISPNDIVENVAVEGEVVNEGTLCNATIQTMANVEGGNLACNIINQGTIEDLTIDAGAVVEGGNVAGEIINSGDLSNVTIDAQAVVTGGNITGIVKNQGTLQDVTIDASVAGGSYGGNIVNNGLVSNATIEQGAILTGGTITGSSINNGTMGDITISPYAEVQGGEFTGDVVNKGTMADISLLEGATLTGGTLTGNVKSAGTIKDVELSEGMQVLGGTLAGEITGDPYSPAQIGAATIEPGAKLSYVNLSPTTVIPENVKFGPGVTIPVDYDNPSPEDFGLASDDIQELQADDIANLEPEVFGTLDEEQTEEIPAEAFTAIEADQLSQFEEESIAVISPEQFEEMPVEALGGLDSDTIDDLSVEVLDKFTPDHVDSINEEEFQKMPSEDVSKLFVNVDLEAIDPKDMAQLIPDGWDLDLKTGEFVAPIGAKITPRNIPTPKNMPAIPDMGSGIGVGGAGTPLMEATTHSLAEEDLTDFVLSQDENGILNVEGTGDSEGKQYTFIPDADNVIQVDTDEMPIGLSVGAGGFYTITTPEGQQYKVIPAPKDPAILSEVTGNEVTVGKRGDVMMKSSNRTRSTEVYEIAIFDPFVEDFADDLCIEISPGNLECDGDLRKRSSRAKTRKIQYPDGTAQIIRPTVLSPDVFIEEALKFEGVEQIVYKADGTFAILYQGKPYFVLPNFTVKNKRVSEKVEPSIIPNEKGSVTYSIAIESETNTRSTEVYEILSFDPFLEAAPDDLCIEIMPGELECDF
ncbi:choice-of-anchor Q domain-containing protein [Candidatus Halobeggiatoa sp. HSG11]|nr:choice-of-anchor Q domain-containing protein [Candidatus Halobeggiatoa sp. HSG11]